MAIIDKIKRIVLAPHQRDAGEKPGAFEDDDKRLAVAVLLVHILAVDGIRDVAEHSAVRRLLGAEYDLSDEQTERLIALATAKDNEAVDIYRFTAALKARTDAAERRRIIEMLWQVSYADGTLHEFEDNLVWRIAELIGVSSRDRMVLKQKVRDSNRTGGAGDSRDGDRLQGQRDQ